jgi:flagellar hook protein FlgE
MSLSNALFAGLSGIDINQTKLNVVGNNIANANTVAFKATRVLFKPQIYATDSAGSPPTADSGGTNPQQRGTGATVAALDRDFESGSIEVTGKNTHLAIRGDGFLVVRSDEVKYTRDGTLDLNTANNLVTSGGEYVQGYGVDPNFDIVSGQLVDLTIPVGSLTIAQATSEAQLKGNLNAAGPLATGASILNSQALTLVTTATGFPGAPTGATALTDIAASSDNTTALFAVGETYTFKGRKDGVAVADASFTVQGGSTLQDLMDFFQHSLGINTTVPDDGDPATPAAGTDLLTSGSDARIVLAGNLGTANALEIGNSDFTSGAKNPLSFADGVDAAGIASGAAGESIRTTFLAYDSLGSEVRVNVTAVFESKATTGNTWRFYVDSPASSSGDRAVATGTLTFDANGQLLTATGNRISIDRSGAGAVTPLDITIDFDEVSSLTSTRSSLAMTGQDGAALGTLADFSIGTDGVITGSFTNGVTRTLGQVALATFDNPRGLVDMGGNMFREGPNSGVAVVGVPGQFGSGDIVAGALELSNVDLSEEFINLIIASTGFSASSRVISTSDRLLTELLNTSR